jgi:hypothetical protein
MMHALFRRRPAKQLIGVEEGTWYYFTTDLSFIGFASFTFVRYVDVNNERKAAIVHFLDQDYFPTRELLLLPYNRKADYFRAEPSTILPVWTFDASVIGAAPSVDLASAWPKNILDKAAITPSIETARRWTEHDVDTRGAPQSWPKRNGA